MDRVRETKQKEKQMRGYKVGLSGMKTSESTRRTRGVKEMCCQDVGQDTVFVMCHCFQNHRPLSTIDENLHTPIWVLVSRSFNKDKKIKIKLRKSQRERERERKRWCEMWYLMVVRVDGWNACLRRSCNIVSPSVLQFHTFHRSSHSFRLCLISQVEVIGYGFRV